ncbi:MAG: adenylate kinase [Candidatus Woesearchaeota archaeon]
MKIVIIGPQGSGKGTQADLISKRFNIPHIDAGQILRDQVAKKTALGKKIEGAMKKGQLLPYRIVNEVIRQRLSEPDCKNGFVLDGYPRQLEEAEFLDGIADIDAVIFLDIPDDIAVKRLSARRVCVGCRIPLYGLPEDIGKACSACGGKLVQREDDKPEAVRNRLKIYHETTEPLVEYYKPRGIIHRVDGRGTVEQVFKAIMQELG